MKQKILPLRLRGMGYMAKGVELLSGIDLEFSAGPLTAIIGPNGAGKSLLLRLCHGLLTPHQGQIEWCGGEARRPRQHQAFVFQQPKILNRSVFENVEYPLKIRGVPLAERQVRVFTTLVELNLMHLVSRPAPLLSGGEQQKLALARASVIEPEVLFLDEPTSNLDPQNAYEMESFIRDRHEEGTKVIMASHDLPQVHRLADEVIFLHKGRIVEKGSAQSLFNSPQCKETAAFLRGELLV